MQLTTYTSSQKPNVISLYVNVFSDSEGESEGETIGSLVNSMLNTTPADDLIGYIAQSDEEIVGCIFLSRMWVPSGQAAFILSPVAVRTDLQRQGVGQQLIRHGLRELKRQGVELVFTYGDPNYYAKLGFKHLSEAVIQAPCELSQPEGWLVQSLTGESIKPMQGKSTCVEALSDARYW